MTGRAQTFLGLLILAIPLAGNGQDVIPASRRIAWDPGVRGGPQLSRTVWTNVTGIDSTGAADVSGVLQAIINACPSNGVVYLPAGRYLLANPLQLNSYRTLRGAGMGRTVLTGLPLIANDSLIVFQIPGYDWDFTLNPACDLTGSVAKDVTNLTTTAPHHWQTGDYLLIDQECDPASDPPVTDTGEDGTASWCGRPFTRTPNGNRVLGQWVKVIGVPSSTGAIITPPLYLNYNLKDHPQATKIKGVIVYAGLEDLTVDSVSSLSHFNVTLAFGVNCWIYRVELRANIRATEGLCRVQGGLWNTIQGCTLQGVGNVSDNSQGYGIYALSMGSAMLIEDNIFSTLELPVALEGGWSGVVIGYNYFTNTTYFDPWPQRQAIGFHAGHATMDLMEGNYSDGCNVAVDQYFGNHSYLLWNRNLVRQNTSRPGYSSAMFTWGQMWYLSFVGNVLGTPGFETIYSIEGQQAFDAETHSIYRLGYYPLNDYSTNGLRYPEVISKTLRHGNWDSVNQAIVWDPSITNHTLTASYYLPVKPAWFGTLRWPPIDPANPQVQPTALPAGYRFLFGTNPPAGPQGRAPITIATAKPMSGSGPLTVDFSSAGSYAPQGVALSYLWSFGDGSSSTAANPQHVFAQAGTYSVTLQVSDGLQTGSSAPLTIVVLAAGANQSSTAPAAAVDRVPAFPTVPR